MRILIPFLFLAACSVPEPQPPTVTTSNDVMLGDGDVPTNEILITRNTEGNIITQRLTQPALFLEARQIGRCTTGEPVLIRVPDGIWSITALTPGGEVTRDVVVSRFQKVALECGVDGIRNPAPILVPQTN